jgi:hypothetical protein
MDDAAQRESGNEAASPCRLFVYLARDAPIGVVLRRGPSEWVRLSLWHTDSDTFEHGQWMRARVYERRCDLSADGSLFVAFVRGSAGPRDIAADSWVAISRLPWFTALALWPIGSTYAIGGWFPNAATLGVGWSATPPERGQLPGWLKLASERPPHIDGTNDWPDRTIWLNRLIRDGWSRREGAEPETWERPSPSGDAMLIMVIHSNVELGAYGGRYIIEYLARDDVDATAASLGFATWADWDQRGRLVVARDGCLSLWEPPDRLSEIADFNGQKPDPQPAPGWATEWPRTPKRDRGR